MSELKAIEKEESKSDNTPHDRLFKSLLSAFFIEFIELFNPQILEYIDPSSVEFLQQEVLHDMVEGSKRIVDLIAKVKCKGKDSFLLINVEAQSSDEPTFDKRLFTYFTRLHLKHDLPVYPIALFTFDKPQKERDNGYVVDFPDLRVLEFQYRSIQLNRLNWRDYLAHENPLASALMAKMHIEEHERVRAKAECIRTLTTFKLDPARTQLISAFIDTYLPLNEQEQERYHKRIESFSQEEQEKIMEFTNSWIEQGRKQEANSLILSQLNHKIGAFELSLEERIADLPLEQVQALGKALLDFKEEADLVQWLQAQVPKEEGH